MRRYLGFKVILITNNFVTEISTLNNRAITFPPHTKVEKLISGTFEKGKCCLKRLFRVCFDPHWKLNLAYQQEANMDIKKLVLLNKYFKIDSRHPPGECRWQCLQWPTYIHTYQAQQPGLIVFVKAGNYHRPSFQTSLWKHI